MAVNIGPKIGIDGEKDYKKSLKDLTAQSKLYAAQMKELESAFDDETSAMEKSRKKGELLKKQIKTQEERVDQLKKKVEESSKATGENSTATLKWKEQLSKANTALNKMKSDLKSLPKSLQQVGQSMQNVGKKMQTVGSTLTKAVTVPLVGLGTASIAAFKEVDSGLDIVAKKTGATGESLTSLQESAKTMATTLPVSFEEAGNAVGEVNTRFGVTGTELENLTTKFLKFSEVNDTDVSGSVDSVQKIMAAFGLETKDTGKLLDVLTATGQKTGISMDTLESSMIKNAAALSDMGLDAYAAAGFLGSVETSGANTETVMSGLTKALSNANEEGKTLPEALGEFQGIMNSTASEQDKLNAAIELFGKKAGPAIYQACKEGSLSFESLSADASEYMGAVEQTFDAVLDPADEFQVALNKVKDAGADIGGTLLEIAAPAIESIGDVAKSAGDWFKSLDDDQQKAVGNIAIALAAGGPVLSALGRLTTGIGNVVTKAGELEIMPSLLAGISNPAFLGAAAVGLLALAFNTMDQDAGYLNETIQALVTDTSEVVSELDTATSNLQETMDNTDENVEKINAQAEAANALVEELAQLESQSSLTAVEQGRMRTIIGELNAMYPNLGIQIDSSTGKLNKSTKEIKSYIENARKMSLLEAYQKASTKGYEDLAEASIALSKARRQEEKNLQTINDLEAEKAELDGLLQDSTGNLVDEAGNFIMTYDDYEKKLTSVSDDIATATTRQEELTTATDAAQEVYDEAESVIADYETAAQELSDSMNDASEATDEETAATEENTAAAESNAEATRKRAAALAEAVTTAMENLGQESKAWSDLYESTRDSIEGQIGLFDKWEEDQEVTTQTILENMRSQIAGMSKYNTNMSKLSAAAAKSSNPNFKAIVKGLAEMGIDGAAYADVLVNAMENDKDAFNQILEDFGTTEGLKDDMAETVTFIESDFKTRTDAALADVVTSVAALGKTNGFQNLKTSASSAVGSVLSVVTGMRDGTIKTTQDIDAAWKKGWSGLPPTAKTASETASAESKNVIDNTKYNPKVTNIGVTKEATDGAEQKIEKNVDPSVTISKIGADSTALSNVYNTIQGWFNRNPITATVKQFIQKVTSPANNAEGGFIQEETLSWLAEGNQPEVVIPLSASKRSRALSLYEQTGRILGANTMVQQSSVITYPNGQRTETTDSVNVGIDTDQLYEAVASAAAHGIENANLRIYWDNREAGRVMRDMGVQFV